jgi:hypothetical protein
MRREQHRKIEESSSFIHYLYLKFIIGGKPAHKLANCLGCGCWLLQASKCEIGASRM